MHFQFANVLVFFGLGVVLVGLMMTLGSLLRPKNPQARKLGTYECGELPTVAELHETFDKLLKGEPISRIGWEREAW